MNKFFKHPQILKQNPHKKSNNVLSIERKFLKKNSQFLSDNQLKNSSRTIKKLLQKYQKSIT